MRPLRRLRSHPYVVLALLALLGVSIWGTIPVIRTHFVQASAHHNATAQTPIQHVVVFMMENHTFDSYFGTYPGVNGVTEPQAPDPLPNDYGHAREAYVAAIDGGQMDQFTARSQVQYKQSDIPIYWHYAQQFGLSDNFYSSIMGGSTPNHMALIAAQTGGLDTTLEQHGCASSQNNLAFSRNPTTGDAFWTYPCYNIDSLPQVLDQNNISWHYYTEDNLWDAPALIKNISTSPNDVHNDAQFDTDLKNNQLSTISWVTPPCGNQCDHPPSPVQGAENYVSGEIDKIMKSQYWNNTAIFVTWDDWGGFYDHVYPTALDTLGLGARVPLLVISPYAKQGYISHSLGEFSSIDKFIEEDYGLPNLGQRDALSQVSDLMDFFDFKQTPRPPDIVQPINYSTSLTVGAYTLKPDLGSTSTAFTYSITYKLSNPAIHNVIIDGQAHAMSPAGTTGPGWTIYKYTTTLPLGQHTYSFEFSDTTGTITLPYNNVQWQGPDVHPFSLGLIVQPSPVMLGKPVSVQVKYISTTNTAPTLAKVDIDSVPHTMTLTKGTDYSAGVIYTYTTTSLPPGVHYARFRFDDGTGVATYESVHTSTVTPLVVANASVSPTSGIASTIFTFHATYSNITGNAPTTANVYVDNTAYTLNYVSGSYSTGALYQLSTVLPTGNHKFAVVFTDPTTGWGDPMGEQLFSGPNVGAGATAVQPGTVITLDPHDDPVIADPLAPLPIFDTQSQSQSQTETSQVDD